MQTESVLDRPREGLDPVVWSPDEDGSYVLSPEAREKVSRIVAWALKEFRIKLFKASLTGSITSNQWKEDSDIDIHIVTPAVTEKNRERMNGDLRKRFAEFSEKNPEKVKIGDHPIEVYFQPNEFQDLMSVGCYDVVDDKWLVGPELKPVDYDPVSDFWDEDMDLVEKVVKKAGEIVLRTWEECVAYKLSENPEFRDERYSEIVENLGKAKKLFDDLRAFRTRRSTPGSEEEAKSMRGSREWDVAESAFKLLDKLGYLRIFKTFSKCFDQKDEVEGETVVETVLEVVGDNFKREVSESEEVPGMPGWRREDLKADLMSWLRERIEEYQLDIEILEIEVFGSRVRGDHRNDSDLDCVVYYRGTREDGKYAREDHIWNMLNGSPECEIDGVSVDFWPTRDEESGSLEDVLSRSSDYDMERGVLKEGELIDEGIGKYLASIGLAMAFSIPGLLGAERVEKALKNVPVKSLRIGSPEVNKAVEKEAEKDEKPVNGLLPYQIVNLVARTVYAEGRGETKEGRKAILSVIMNRTGNDPAYAKAVIQEPDAFSCWRSQNWDKYKFDPPKSVGDSPRNMEIWNECKDLATQFYNGTFKSTIGNFNSYMNKKKASKNALV